MLHCRMIIVLLLAGVLASFAVACDGTGGVGLLDGDLDIDGVTTCVTREDCPEDWMCISNFCVDPDVGDIGGVDICEFDYDCPAGYHCDSNICVQDPGFPCDDKDCPIGFVCVDGFCLSDGESYPCTTSDECPSGAICKDGYCWWVKVDGDNDLEGSGEGDAEDVYGPQILVPDEVDFGAAILNSPVIRVLNISSVGTEDLMVYSVILDGSSDEDYSILDAPDQAVKLPPGDLLVVNIALTATMPGRRTGKLIITSNDKETNTVEVSLSSLYKGEPHIDVDPDNVEFGRAQVGLDAVEREVKICNKPLDEESNRVLDVSAIELGTPANPHFEIDLGGDSLPLQIGPDEINCYTFIVLYHPTTVDAHSEVLTISNNDPQEENREYVVLLSGEGVIPQLEMTPVGDIHFGLVSLNNGEDREVTLTNVGGALLRIDQVSLGLPEDATFNLEAGAAVGAELQSGQSVVITLTYTPVDVVNNATSLVIVSNSYIDPDLVVRVDGRGIQSDIRTIPPYLEFGDVPVGSTKDIEVVVRNEGDDTLQVLDIQFDELLSEFTVVELDATPMHLLPGSSDILTIRYSPLDEDADSGLALFVIDISTGDYELPISGRGVLPHVSWQPAGENFDFGQVIVGTEGVIDVTFHNDGLAPLELFNLRMDPAPENNFLAVPGDDAIIDPGQDYIVSLRYSPPIGGVDGPEEQHLYFNTTDPDYPDVVFNLSGEPIDPQMDIDPAVDPYDFGEVEFGNSKTATFILTNIGTGQLEINGLTLSEDSMDSGYALDTQGATFPIYLDSPTRQAEYAFTVTFTPPDFGPRYNGEVTILCNDRRYPSGYELNLTGEGAGCEDGYHLCDGVCSPDNSAESCGDLCEACPEPDYSAAACTWNEEVAFYFCDFVCDPGYVEYEGTCKDAGSVDCCGDACLICPDPVDEENSTSECLDGECVFLCTAGMHLCGDNYCYFDSDTTNCGPDCVSCDTPDNGVVYCIEGNCTPNCNEGLHFCDDGNCYTANDVEHCGEDCVQCTAPEGGSVLCIDGECAPQCPEGEHICDGACFSVGDPSHCGEECSVCPVPANGEALCIEGECRPNCYEGYHTCGDNCYSVNDITHCGDECEVCPVPNNGQANCNEGECLKDCNDTFHLCDDGQCYSADDIDNCGDDCVRCDSVVNGEVLCLGGECSQRCLPQTHFCGEDISICYSDNDITHCGEDCLICPQPPNSRAFCVGGVCDTACNQSYHMCDDNLCYSDSDTNNCGPFCLECDNPNNGQALCLSGACSKLCDPFHHLCDDGHCYSDADVTHCGGACSQCTPPGGGYAECVDGICRKTCYPSDHICHDQNCYPSNDVTHCGEDCDVCPTPVNGIAICDGSCRAQCDPGFHFCDDGQCYPNDDISHCGEDCSACDVPQNGYSLCDGTCHAFCDNGNHMCPDGKCEANDDIKACGPECISCPIPISGDAACLNNECVVDCYDNYHACPDGHCYRDDSISHCGVDCLACSVIPHGESNCIGGICVTTCTTGYHSCADDQCYRVDDVNNCGESCENCFVPNNGRAFCQDEACVQVCDSGFHECSDGHCYSDYDQSHCGDNCDICETIPNALTSCSAGDCTITCNGGYHKCTDGDDVTCESNSNPQACGDTCLLCDVPLNGSATCVNGQCGMDCQGDMHLCDEDGSFACRDNDDPDHCGDSCTACPGATGGSAICNNGQCGLACPLNYHLCGSTCYQNADPGHCGTDCEYCDSPQGGDALCSNGECSMVCDPGMHICEDAGHSSGFACYSDENPDKCGSNCTDCGEPTGGSATCTNGQCGTTCPSGEHLCQDDFTCYGNTDPDNCGSSCTDCADPVGAGNAVCVNGSCDVQCQSGFHECTSGNTVYCYPNDDEEHCGAGCLTCDAPIGGNATCLNGQCEMTCDPGLHSCWIGPDPNDYQCFSDADPSRCGDSCTSCEAPDYGSATCVNDTCGTSCPADWHICGTAGNLSCHPNNDPDNCGSSCTDCEEPSFGDATCVNGSCGTSCPSGTHICGSAGSLACRANDDAENCGTGCTTCPAPDGGVAECINGQCDQSCGSGQHLCGNTCYDNDDEDHCGASCFNCDEPTDGFATCLNGLCGQDCPGGAHLCSIGGGNFQCFVDSDGAHCGDSCTACPEPAGSGYAACINDSCAKICNPGNHLCNGDCYADEDAEHCSLSCTNCSAPANGVAQCINNSCTFECDPYYTKIGNSCSPNSLNTRCGINGAACQAAGPNTVGICVDNSSTNPENPYYCSYACSSGYIDYNSNFVDGCECQYQSSSDPIGDGIDQNCDEVDGLMNQAIYVTKDGNDSNNGSYLAPVATINRGLLRSYQNGKSYILVTGDRYQENVVLTGTYQGKNLLGGYAASFRTRDTIDNLSTLEGVARSGNEFGALTALNIQSTTTEVSGFEIVGIDVNTPTVSSYAVYVRNCDNHLVLTQNRIVGGEGGDGPRGNNGSAGSDGNPGYDGIDSKYAGSSSTLCSGTNAGGAGGSASCGSGRAGGQGGTGACPVTYDLQQDVGSNGGGASGQYGGGGAGGYNSEIPGLQGYYYYCSLCPTPSGPKAGSPGQDGANGSDGYGGGACTDRGGINESSWEWETAVGGNGANGTYGGGGGGGGAGGGNDIWYDCYSKPDAFGGSGGGGGGGGCRGTRGLGGTAAGSSFAVLVLFTTAPSSTVDVPQIYSNTVVLGIGGNGGDGGSGGAGGSGGTSGKGGEEATGTQSDQLWCTGSGGTGGSGGRGGHGGGGGGGCGGNSYGIFAYEYASGSYISGWTNTYDTTSGWAGSGGTGGFGGFAGNGGADGWAGVQETLTGLQK